MADPFAELSELDRLIHEPARLAILTALSACATADFVFLQRLTGLTQGNLSSHLTKLADAGLIAVTKSFSGKTPRTTVAITPEGTSRIDGHWDRLAALRTQARLWRPPTPAKTPAE
jgi:DNA-binding transcriptional ArsR family regulator